MGDMGEGGVKNLKKWMISFMDNPYQNTEQVRFWHGKGSSLKYVVARFLPLVTTMVTKVDHGN